MLRASQPTEDRHIAGRLRTDHFIWNCAEVYRTSALLWMFSGLEFAPKAEYDSTDNEEKRDNVIPPHVLAKIDPCKRDEHAERDHFLDDFQLKRCELAVPDAVRRNLKAVFEESDQPAHDDDSKERRLSVLQVTVPGDGHKDIGADEKEDGFHSGEILARRFLKGNRGIPVESTPTRLFQRPICGIPRESSIIAK
jgi:hypothetical protein